MVMVGCYFIASKLRNKKEMLEGPVNNGLTVMMYFIVFIMGIRMGSNEQIIENLGTIGIQAVIISILTIAFSVLFVTIMRKVMKIDKYGDVIAAPHSNDNMSAMAEVEEFLEEEEVSKSSENLKTTLYIAIDVVIAMLIGFFAIRRIFAENYEIFDAVSSNAIVAGLSIMISFVGLSLGLDGTVISKLKETGIKVLIVPVMMIFGTTFAGVVFSLITEFSMKEALAICWGFLPA